MQTQYCIQSKQTSRRTCSTLRQSLLWWRFTSWSVHMWSMCCFSMASHIAFLLLFSKDCALMWSASSSPLTETSFWGGLVLSRQQTFKQLCFSPFCPSSWLFWSARFLAPFVLLFFLASWVNALLTIWKRALSLIILFQKDSERLRGGLCKTSSMNFLKAVNVSQFVRQGTRNVFVSVVCANLVLYMHKRIRNGPRNFD